MQNTTPPTAASPSDADLQAEIDVLRAQYPETQALYREVCVLLFFRHGITPTANRLYQLVRKGSMSAPAEALTRFWATLRDKSRVRIEHPDLPVSLQDTAGEMVAALWQRAQAAALEAVESLQNDAKVRVLAADGLVHEAQLRCTAQALKLAAVQQLLQATQQQLQMTQAELSRSQGEGVALQRQVDSQAGERQTLVDGFNAAQQRSAVELQQQRNAAMTEGLALEERHTAELKRLILEIDRERGNTSKSQKELEQARQTQAAGAEVQRQQTLQQQEQHDKTQALADGLRLRSGALEGSVAELREQRSQLLGTIEALRERLDQGAVATTPPTTGLSTTFARRVRMQGTPKMAPKKVFLRRKP